MTLIRFERVDVRFQFSLTGLIKVHHSQTKQKKSTALLSSSVSGSCFYLSPLKQYCFHLHPLHYPPPPLSVSLSLLLHTNSQISKSTTAR